MAIDALSAWRSDFETLPKVVDTSWANNLANWADGHVTNKMGLSGTGGTGLTFIFNKASFAAELLNLTPENDALAGITGFAEAWEVAMNSSTAATAPGTFIGSSTPATLWSSVSSTTILAPSIAAGKAKIIELASSDPVDDVSLSDFPVKFREAFLLLTITTLGLDSTPPATGPLPLNDIARAVN